MTAVGVRNESSPSRRSPREYYSAAPGPDGFVYPDFGRQEATRALQRLRAEVLAGTYRSPPPRLVRVPKPTPGAFRTLALDEPKHRALATSVLRSVAPHYAPHISPMTHSAGTPPRGVFCLLADLAAAWEFGDSSVLLNLDIKTAFPSVPVGPHMAVVHTCIADERPSPALRPACRARKRCRSGTPLIRSS